jgi:hypothetical protein
MLVVVCLWLLSTGCQRKITVPEAQRAADRALQAYCRQEKLPLSQFPPPAVSVTPGGSRMFDYRSRGKPRHLVIVHVDRQGGTEVHRMIE